MKACLLFVGMLVLAGAAAFAQGFDTAWVRTFDGPESDDDRSAAMAIDNDGNVFVVGYTVTAATAQDLLVIKYLANGDLDWVNLYDGPGWATEYDVAEDIVVDQFGNAYVFGSSDNTGNSTDYVVIKYLPNGDTAWVRSYVDPLQEIATAGALDGDGNVYVTGRFVSAATEIGTMKYSNDGELLWISAYNGPTAASHGASDIAVDDAGNAYVTGYTNASNFCTIKYDIMTGDTLWVREFDGPDGGDDYGRRIAVNDASYGVFVIGYVQDAGGKYDLGIVKYESDGTEAWTRIHELDCGNSGEYLGLVQEESGDIWACGPNYSIPGSDHISIFRYNTNGMAVEPEFTYPEPGTDHVNPYGMCIDEHGYVYIAAEGTTMLKYSPESELVGEYDLGYGQYNDGIAADDLGNAYVAVREVVSWPVSNIVTARLQPAPVLTVTNLDDSGPGSLRYALEQANLTLQPDTIRFDVSGIIQPQSALPSLHDDFPIYIEGWTAPEGSYSVILNGADLIEGNGFLIESSGNMIGDISVVNFPGNGFEVIGASAQNNDIGGCKVYNNGGLAIDLGGDGVTVNDPGDLDQGPNDLVNYPEVDSVIMGPDSSFTVYGSTVENPMWAQFYISSVPHGGAEADPSGHGEAYGMLDRVLATPTFEFTIPNTVPFFSVISTAAIRDSEPAATSELGENFTLIPSPLTIIAYSYPAEKNAPPSVVNLWVTDPDSNYIGRDASGVQDQTIDDATYHEDPVTGTDSVTITNPLQGTYIIEIIAEDGAGEGDQYSAGVILNGSAHVTLANQNSVPLYASQPDTLEYEVEDGWHYVNGDADRNGSVDIDDAVYMINYIFAGGPVPDPLNAGDADCSYELDIDDVVYLIAYIFSGGPAPCEG